uniref:DUF2157 domain-containing protein n=1 Tax=Bicosoecida sp. CB-2014 TaxID=1486930 RepID=A0A7S1CMI1_9STRA|mmetsp:Transcript_4289/g.15800  ORF Transcript_4289/g.15800 Transcript_4289/m.15800 type:complete len:413 (+) Transcript_4289:80-1318(+)
MDVGAEGVGEGDPMLVSRSQHDTLIAALRAWRGAGHIDDDTHDRLEGSLKIRRTDWARVARYAAWCAIACFVISFVSLLAEEWLIELVHELIRRFGGLVAPETVGAVACGALAAALYAAGGRMRTRASRLVARAAKEAGEPDPGATARARSLVDAAVVHRGSTRVNGVFFLGGVAHLACVCLLRLHLLADVSDEATVLALALSYAAVAVASQSQLTWLLGLGCLTVWWCNTVAFYHGGGYYFGIRLPVRALALGCVFVAAGRAVPAAWAPQKLTRFRYTTYVVGLLLVFMSLEILSISGVDGRWQSTTLELFGWCVAYGVAAAAAAGYGIVSDDGTSRNMGITFALLNLYTRFFEHLWDATSKAAFFFLLGLSLWVVATRSERVLARTRRFLLQTPSREEGAADKAAARREG